MLQKCFRMFKRLISFLFDQEIKTIMQMADHSAEPRTFWSLFQALSLELLGACRIVTKAGRTGDLAGWLRILLARRSVLSHNFTAISEAGISLFKKREERRTGNERKKERKVRRRKGENYIFL